jgi:myo-inositol 2-dehydrogenase/D-chiro-inositol 1-dehydrogenase
MSAAEARTIVDRELEIGHRLVQVGFMREYDAAHVAVRDTVRSGAIGAPVLFRGRHVNPSLEHLRFTARDAIVKSLIHDLHSGRFLVGSEVVEVYAQSVPLSGDPDLSRLVTVSCRFASGAVGLMDVNMEGRYGYEVTAEIVGETGTVRTLTASPSELLVAGTQSRPVHTDWPSRFGEAYRVELDAWLAAAATGGATGPSAWDGYASLVIADACADSVERGAPVRVDLAPVPGLYA